MAIMTFTPVEPAEIGAELSGRGYFIAHSAPIPDIHVPVVDHGPEPIIPIITLEDHVPTPVIHIPIEDHVPTPVIHVPFEDHAPTPVIHIEEEDLPDIHIPVEALAGWRRYANWLPLLSLLAREKDIMDLT